jgi:hypothetical protein
LTRLPIVAFATLAVATVAAFFVTQHLKVTTPLIAGYPAPAPSWINPVDGTVCGGVDHRRTFVSFYLQHRSDDVDVYVVDQTGAIVRTVAVGRHMRRGVRKPDGVFSWNGREDNGQVAPDGIYYFRVALIHQGRTADISNPSGVREPITVRTIPPRPVVTSVSPSLIPQDGRSDVTIHYTGTEHRGGIVQVYRTGLPGDPRVKQFRAGVRTAIWDGMIDQRPAPPGTYLVGFQATDQACNTGRFPIVMPPAPGTTPHAGVTVRYIAAQPPLRPVPAGSVATVYVDARQQPYRWALRRSGSKTIVSKGTGTGFALSVKLPAGRGGMYELALRAGGYRTVVPIVASVPAVSRQPRVLVVLPALTWQGLNPVDDTGDGLPNTLQAGGPIALNRPFAGFPADAVDEAGLLAYLDRSHRTYDATTDVGLLQGFGPTLQGHSGVILAGSARWLPASLQSTLRAYVENGGNVVSLGIDSLRRSVTVQGERAFHPTQPSADDALGARPGALVTHNTALITVIPPDRLGIFSQTSGAFPGFGSYQPIPSVAAPGQIESEAGATTRAPSVVGYRLGRGVVVDVGLVGFGSRLAHNVDAQELVDGLWKLLSK